MRRANDMRRDEIQILADILKLEEASKTEIMYMVNMSYHQLGRYLGYLLQMGFLKRAEGDRTTTYQITPKGMRLLRQIEKVEDLLSLTEEPSQ